MKWIVPSEVQIGGRIIRIRVNEKALDVADLQSQLSLQADNIIRISLVLDGKARATIVVLQALCHEIAHAIDALYMKELEERQVGVLGEGFAQALISMGIEPDFSQIPEEET